MNHNQSFARQQYGSMGITRLVQHKVGVWLAGCKVLAGKARIQIAPLVKQVGPKTGFTDGLEELLGNDGVGINVFAVHRGHKPLVYGEFLHGEPLFSGRVFNR